MLAKNILEIVIFTVLLFFQRGNGMPISQNQMEIIPVMRIDAQNRDIGDLIENSGFFPIQINVPDMIMSLWQGAQLAVNGAAQSALPLLPFLQPLVRPDHPRPLKNVLILLPARINKHDVIIPVFKPDPAAKNLHFDISVLVDRNTDTIIDKY